jgi:heat shock protein HtpX
VVIIAVALIVLAGCCRRWSSWRCHGRANCWRTPAPSNSPKNPDAMISALRKIENRGELPGATSAVMELCVDNPREGFADLFATHPSVNSRVKALVQFAGGHDPGPLVLPSDGDDEPEDRAEAPSGDQLPPPVPRGPWSNTGAPAGGPPPVPQQGPSAGSFSGSLGPAPLIVPSRP